MARVDYDKQAGVYDRARELTPEGTAAWMVAARRHAPSAERILDLGSGTGRFSAALADAFEADVIAVEPSAGMRGQAAAKPHDRVHVIAGAAEAIPLADATIHLAWLSNVIHHFDDMHAAAGELRRVVAGGGTVLLRGAVGGKPVPTLYRFFPGTQSVVDSFPSIPQIVAAFENAGFGYFFNEQVTQKLADSLAEMHGRLKLRADSTLEAISDEEFERGLELLTEAARVEHGPVLDTLDLLVIR